jgi:hypothetical protein
MKRSTARLEPRYVTSQRALFFTFCSGTQRRKKNVSNTKQSLMKWKVRVQSKTKMSGNKLAGPLKLFAVFSCMASGKK